MNRTDPTEPTEGQVHVRPAGPDDLHALVRLLGVLFSIEADFTIDEDRQRRGLMMMLDDPERRCVLVACVDGRVVGMCTAQMVISTAEGGPVAWVEDVVIEPAFRGQGMGRRLLGTLQEWVRQRGGTRLQLVADVENEPALRFYLHLGWQRTQLVCLRRK